LRLIYAFVQMIYTGIDIVEIGRVERLLKRFPQKFPHRVFTAREIEEAAGRGERFASRFAAKEAVKKILTDGGDYLPWRSIETTRAWGRAPRVHLYGDAAARAAELGISSFSVSLTHSAGVAVASAVAEARDAR